MPQAPTAAVPEAPTATSPLPHAYHAYTLGASLEEVKTSLSGDSSFLYRGDADVSFLPRRNENVIDCAGRDYIKRGFFQFHEGKLFIMTFNFNTALLDHYSVYQTLVKKYGEPKVMTSRKATWEDDAVQIVLERPLTLTYIDKAVFDALVADGKASPCATLYGRQQFLDQL